jgi:hypothetical protein
VTWLLWRQHRLQAATSAVLLGLLAILLAVTGVHMADVYRHAVTRCGNCLLVGSLFQGYGAVIDMVNVTVAVPLLLGVVFGSVLLARETEQATHVLAWTQTTTRRRWLLTKVATALSLTVLIAGGMTAIVTWWSGTPNSLYQDRFSPLKFDTQNLMPVAFAVFALGVGFLAGALIRRSLPTIAVTVGGFLACRLLFEVYVRPYLQAPASFVNGMTTQQPVPQGAWVLGSTFYGPTGKAISGPFDPQTACPNAFNRTTAADCLNRLGYHIKVSFQPAARYWHFQWVEAGAFAVAGIVLLLVGIFVTLRRDA